MENQINNQEPRKEYNPNDVFNKKDIQPNIDSDENSNIEFFNDERADGKNKFWNFFKKKFIAGLIIGIILVIINSIFWGIPSVVLGPVYSWSTFQFHELGLCSGGESCWGISIIFGDLLFFFLPILVIIFFGYAFNREIFHYNIKKVFIVGIIIFIFIFVNTFAFLEMEVESFIANNKLYDYPSFKTENECKNFFGWGFEPIGKCLGFFASEKNNVDYCQEVTKSFKKVKDNDFVASCISAFSIYQNDIKYCDEIKIERMEQEKCSATNYVNGIPKSCTCTSGDMNEARLEQMKNRCKEDFYMAKNNKSDCEKINDKKNKELCLNRTGTLNYLIRSYAKFRGKNSFTGIEKNNLKIGKISPVNPNYIEDNEKCLNEAKDAKQCSVETDPGKITQCFYNTSTRDMKSLRSTPGYEHSASLFSGGPHNRYIIQKELQDNQIAFFNSDFFRKNTSSSEIMNGYQYVLCSSQIPEKISIKNTIINGNEAVVDVEEDFGNTKKIIQAFLKIDSGLWKVYKVICP